MKKALIGGAAVLVVILCVWTTFGKKSSGEKRILEFEAQRGVHAARETARLKPPEPKLVLLIGDEAAMGRIPHSGQAFSKALKRAAARAGLEVEEVVLSIRDDFEFTGQMVGAEEFEAAFAGLSDLVVVSALGAPIRDPKAFAADLEQRGLRLVVVTDIEIPNLASFPEDFPDTLIIPREAAASEGDLFDRMYEIQRRFER